MTGTPRKPSARSAAADRLRAVLDEQAELLFDTRQKSMTLTRVENETALP